MFRSWQSAAQEREGLRPPKRRTSIPRVIKLLSWDHHVGPYVGRTKCICCQERVISMGEFEAGHIIAVAKGGPTTVWNLLPICSTCNRSMGTMNMSTFVATYFPANHDRYRNRQYSWLLPDGEPRLR